MPITTTTQQLRCNYKGFARYRIELRDGESVQGPHQSAILDTLLGIQDIQSQRHTFDLATRVRSTA